MGGSMRSIAVLGSMNADLVVQMDRYPNPGETVVAKSFVQFSGGKGANQAVACGRFQYPLKTPGPLSRISPTCPVGTGRSRPSAILIRAPDTAFPAEPGPSLYGPRVATAEVSVWP